MTRSFETNSWSSSMVQSGGQLIERRCTFSFGVSEDGIVEWYRYSGNDCKLLPTPAPYDCLVPGKVLRIDQVSSAGELVSFYTDSFSGRWSMYQNGFSPETAKGRTIAASWRTNDLIVVCVESGVGTYLLTPDKKVVLGSFLAK
jgi:hypothetical protein